MKPLIEIQTVPISLEFKINSAKTERQTMNAELEITRDRKGLTITSQPIRLNVDTYDARNTIVPSTTASIKQYAQDGVTVAYDATANFVEEGNMLLNIHLEQDALSQIAKSRMGGGMKDFNVGFIPSAPADISWTPGDMTIQYEMDKLNFDWKIGSSKNIKFVPASIEFNIKQYPKVVIEYIGEPIYVPPSSNPNYQPIDTKA